MIALGLRVVLRGGRESAIRIVAIAAGVAVGVVLILLAISTLNGLRSRDLHSGWLATATHNRQPSAASFAAGGLLWRKTSDQFGSQRIARVDVAALGPRSPVPPGIRALPTAGQYYASPALAEILRTTPADQLGNRFPGRLIGIITRAGLPSPHALIIVIGHERAQLAGQPGAITVRSIETAPTKHTYTTFQAVALGIGAAGLLIPVLIFVGMATRIAAARREQRLAAMRLVGATVPQVAALAAIEAASAAMIGTSVGIGLFYALRPMLAGIQLIGDSWFTNDLSLGWLTLTVTFVGVPLAAAVAAVSALTRVRVSPLGVTRRATPVPPKATRLIPLGLGTLLLAVFALAGHPYARGASSTYAPTIVAAFVLIIVGIVVAGPWLTQAFARLLAVRSARPAGLIASRRLADNPAAAFRAVSGLILAVFVGSVFAGGAATASSPTSLGDDPGAGSTVISRPAGTALPASNADRIGRQLRALPGVNAVTLIHASPRDSAGGFPRGLVDCPSLAATPEIGRCARSGVISLPLYALDVGHTQPNTNVARRDHLADRRYRAAGAGDRRRHRRSARDLGTDPHHYRYFRSRRSQRPENVQPTQRGHAARCQSASTPRRPRHPAQRPRRGMQPHRRRRRRSAGTATTIQPTAAQRHTPQGSSTRRPARGRGTPDRTCDRLRRHRPAHRDTAPASGPRHHHSPARQQLLPHAVRRHRHCARPRRGNDASAPPDQLTGKRAGRIDMRHRRSPPKH